MTIAEGGVSTSSSTANDNDDNLDVNVNSSTDNSSSSVDHVDTSRRSSTTTNTIGVTSITIDKSAIATDSAPSTLDDKHDIIRGVHGIDTSGRSSITTMSSPKPSTGETLTCAKLVTYCPVVIGRQLYHQQIILHPAVVIGSRHKWRRHEEPTYAELVTSLGRQL